jgi:hypothetical protein
VCGGRGRRRSIHRRAGSGRSRRATGRVAADIGRAAAEVRQPAADSRKAAAETGQAAAGQAAAETQAAAAATPAGQTTNHSADGASNGAAYARPDPVHTVDGIGDAADRVVGKAGDVSRARGNGQDRQREQRRRECG